MQSLLTCRQMPVHKDSVAEKSIFIVILNYLIIPCPDTRIVNDKADALTGMIASIQKLEELCLVKRNILQGRQATQ